MIQAELDAKHKRNRQKDLLTQQIEKRQKISEKYDEILKQLSIESKNSQIEFKESSQELKSAPIDCIHYNNSPIKHVFHNLNTLVPSVTNLYEQVTVSFFVGSFLDEVYYNGVNIRDQVYNADTNSQWKVVRFFRVKDAVLCLGASAAGDGSQGALSIKSHSTVKDSVWNF